MTTQVQNLIDGQWVGDPQNERRNPARQDDEPIGVAALITPWNCPIASPAWKAAPAQISGNAVFLKPAELTPLSATHLVRVSTNPRAAHDFAARPQVGVVKDSSSNTFREQGPCAVDFYTWGKTVYLGQD